MNEVEKFILDVKTNTIILTEELMSKISELHDIQQKEKQELIERIRNGAKIGIPDEYTLDGYYPLEFVELLDEETGLCKFYERSITKYHELTVFMVSYDY